MEEQHAKECSYCNVKLLSAGIAQQHFGGKKHRKVVEAFDAQKALCERSVFFGNIPKNQTCPVEIEFQHYFETEYGTAAAKVTIDPVKREYVLVEFGCSQHVPEILEKCKHTIAGVKLTAKPKKMKGPLSSHPATQGSVHNGSEIPSTSSASVYPPNSAPTTSNGLNLSACEGQASICVELLTSLAGCSSVDEQLEMLVNHNVKGVEDFRKSACVDYLDWFEGELRTLFLDFSFKMALYGSMTTGLAAVGSSDVDVTMLVDNLGVNGDDDGFLKRSADYLLQTPIDHFMGESRISHAEFVALSPAEKIRLLKSAVKFMAKKYSKKILIASLEPVLSPRCPVLRWANSEGWKYDMSVNNHLAIANSAWIKSIMDSDERVRTLVFCVRAWAGVAHLTAHHGGKAQALSNYALTLMVISFLQCTGMLLSLDETRSRASLSPKFVSGWDASFPLSTSSGASNGCAKHESSMAQLMKGFFKWGCETLWSRSVLSIKTGSIVDLEDFKAQMNSNRRLSHFAVASVNIQDPFVLSHNTAGSVGVDVSKRLGIEFRRARSKIDCPSFWTNKSAAKPFGLVWLLTDKQSDLSTSGIAEKEIVFDPPASLRPPAIPVVTSCGISQQNGDCKAEGLTIAEELWLNTVKNRVSRILTEVMLFHQLLDTESELLSSAVSTLGNENVSDFGGDASCSPTDMVKRLKLCARGQSADKDGKSADCQYFVMPSNTISGRRGHLRRVKRDYPDLSAWDQEKETSRLLSSQHPVCHFDNPEISNTKLTENTTFTKDNALTFSLEYKIDANSSCIVAFTNMSAHQEGRFIDLWHFMETFLPKMFALLS